MSVPLNRVLVAAFLVLQSASCLNAASSSLPDQPLARNEDASTHNDGRALTDNRVAHPSSTERAAPNPEKQVEKDWVDGRWNQTDVGPFLASTLFTPNGPVAKGLSIRVGEYGEAAVCYDTAEGALRAGWTGGFLEFDPARFGLIRAPRIAGQLRFLGPADSAPAGPGVHYEGLHLSGKRVVLSWRIGETLLRESPWIETAAGASAFTRTLELGAGAAAVTLSVLEETNATSSLFRLAETGVAAFERDGRLTSVACLGAAGARFTAAGNRISVVFPPREQMCRGKLLIWSGGTNELGGFEKLLRESPPPAALAELARPGPARWGTALTTRGQLGISADLFAIDTLTVPYDNPSKALMFLSGVDFVRDGTAFVCSIHGDVWRITGIDESLRALTWKRFATGLFQPLGLRVVGDKVFVLGRDQITLLHDENGDGEADFYENFCNLIDTSSAAHEYVTSLETDPEGNLYYADPRGAHRISADGRAKQTLATGWRNPNGLGVGPQGIITVAPQQGEWTPSSAICEVKPDGYYGYPGAKVTAERPLGYDPPLCWIPHSVDNSGASQVWVPPGHWGPLAGQMLHLVWGRCAMMLVLRDVSGGVPQGAAIPLPGRFLSGPMRATFRRQDGHLYVAGSTGWQTSAVRDGSLQRVRYTGKSVYLPLAYHAHSNGLALTFSQPLERKVAEDTGSYGLSQWNYRYAPQYGSDDWSVADPSRKGHDPVEVKSAKLLADGRTVFLEIAGLRPVMQMEIKHNLDAADGHKIRGVMYATINEPGPNLTW